MLSMQFYRESKEMVLEHLQTAENGLTQQEVQKRLERDGYNEIKGKEKVPTWKIFLETFKDSMVIVLLIAAGVQLALGEVVESIIIFLVLIINSVKRKRLKAHLKRYRICLLQVRKSFGMVNDKQ